MSKLSMGTYLGDFSDEDSSKYRESIEYGLLRGIRHIDTAVNYRGMRSERDIGQVLPRLIDEGVLRREDVIISTKAGFIPGDGELMFKPVDYLQAKFIDTGILTMEDIDINEGLRLTLNPSFYDYAIQLSLDHMKIDYIDVHYIHEPELKKEMIGDEAFYASLKPLFEFYEKKVAEGVIKTYGMATWHCFELDEDHPRHISLERVIKQARAVNPHHAFRHIMLPFNKVMNQAATKKTQTIEGQAYTALEAAKKLGLVVSTSGSINRGQDIDKAIEDHIQYNISQEEVDIMIIGMKQVDHMKENMSIFNRLSGK